MICQKCNQGMKPLFLSWFCPNCENKLNNKSKHFAWIWYMEDTKNYALYKTKECGRIAARGYLRGTTDLHLRKVKIISERIPSFINYVGGGYSVDREPLWIFDKDIVIIEE